MNCPLFRHPCGLWVRSCPHAMNIELLLTAASRIGGSQP